MKKKISLLLLGAILACCLAGCAGLTHCKECDDEVYKDGYCKYHYEINAAKEKIDDLGKDVFDFFGK
ncbi:MAG: hypothetical protein ACI4FZ_11865 [Lachnospiraceae bacterium]